MPRASKGRVTRVLVGHVPAFTRKLIVVDPAAIESFQTDKRRRGKRKRDFAYSGACAAVETKLRAAELMDGSDQSAAVVVKTPKNKNYPVYALIRDGRPVRLVIVFDEDPCGERPTTKKRGES